MPYPTELLWAGGAFQRISVRARLVLPAGTSVGLRW